MNMFKKESTLPKARFITNHGEFILELNTDHAPITTNNFIKLVKEGFYDGTKFHRIIKKFMIQGGDPLSKHDNKQHRWGTGGPGYKIQDEFSDDLSNERYTISMANSGPDTGGSQFFINVVHNHFLNNKHAVFGKVIKGQNIVMKISKVKTKSSDMPLDRVVIEKIIIE